jgi:hypothetical protein
LIFEIDVTEISWAVYLMMTSTALAWNLTPPPPTKKMGLLVYGLSSTLFWRIFSPS